MFFKKQDDDLFISKKELKDYNKKYSEPYDSVKNDGENNMILSQNIRLGLDYRKTDRNQNVFCIGGAGTGTSRGFIQPNILQANSSFVINDPGGNLYYDYKEFLENEGYKIKTLNLINTKNSNHYNPFNYIQDEEDVKKLVDCIIYYEDSISKRTCDRFWEDSEKALLQALMFYLIKYRPKEEQNFNSILKLLSKASIDENDPDFESPLDKIFKQVEKNDPQDITIKQYKTFKEVAGKSFKGILISVSVHLSIFNISEIINLTQEDNIELEKLGDEKTALFVITPTADDTYNFLTSIIYKQLFTTLYNHAEKEYIPSRLPYHVQFLLNDFENMGQIPEFEKIIATMRPYNISCSIITQHILQIKEIYNLEEIRGNCDTLLFFGSANEEVLKYIENLLSGSLNINSSELFSMNNEDLIIMIRGINPFKDKKFLSLEQHINYNKYIQSIDNDN